MSPELEAEMHTLTWLDWAAREMLLGGVSKTPAQHICKARAAIAPRLAELHSIYCAEVMATFWAGFDPKQWRWDPLPQLMERSPLVEGRAA